MQNRVVVEELPMQMPRRAFTAAVEVELERDLSLTRFVRGPELERVLEAVRASYPQVCEKADATALMLRESMQPVDLSGVDPLEHAADRETLQRGRSVTTRVGGVAIAGALVVWAVIAAGVAVPQMVPLVLLGAGVLLVLRELG
jgi:hypothetical protein